MNRNAQKVVMVAAALAATACSDFLTTRRTGINADLAVAFATVPTGYAMTQSTYDNASEGTGPFFPGGPFGGLGRGPGPGMGGGFGPMIGGGLGGDFLGGPGLGRDLGHGRHGDPKFDDSACTFNSATGRVECPPVTDRGLTITKSIAFTDAAGKAQTAFDSVTTNTINSKVSVAGTIVRHDSATSVISNASDRTVGGLAKGSTTHTVNGTAAGREVTTGKDGSGATFTATRTAADTTRAVSIPVTDSKTYPTAGTVIREMHVSVVRSSGTTTSNRREVITYDGSATAKMVITQDGTTKTCTLPLPFGRPTCA